MEKTDPAHYCTACKNWKPPRSHHCRHCNRCVYMLDHHCPWLGNCIGYYNYKYFVLSVMYCASVTIFYDITIAYIYISLPKPQQIFSGAIVWVQFGFFLLGNFIGLPMCCLLLGQISMLFSGITSVDAMQGGTTELCWTAACCPRENSGNPYQLGVVHAVARLWGKWVFTWILPIVSYNKAGFEFDEKPAVPTMPETAPKAAEAESSVEAYFEEIEREYKSATLEYGEIVALNNSASVTAAAAAVPTQPAATGQSEKKADDTKSLLSQ